MTKIAILGGNSQVGAEVSFFLSLKKNIELVNLIRSEYSAPFLKLLSLPYRVVDYFDRNSMEAVLSDCELVLDFTSPTGQITDLLQSIENNMLSILNCMKAGGKYIYMSSVMAFGMPSQSERIKNHVLPRTAYASLKRCAEKYARAIGRKRDIQVFIFRLGQVHGVLQLVTQKFISQLEEGRLCVNGNPKSYTNTVFASSVSEAVLKCVGDGLKPGTYTIVSAPQWTLEELFHFYRVRYGVKGLIEYGYKSENTVSLRSTVIEYLWSRMISWRDLLETYLLLRIPLVASKVKGLFRIKVAAHEIARMKSKGSKSSKVDLMLLGVTPAPTITAIRSSLQEIVSSEQALEAALNNAIILK